MKKTILKQVILLAVLGIVLAGCSKKDDDNAEPAANSDLVGVWTCTSVNYTSTAVSNFMGQSFTTETVGEGYDIDFKINIAENPKKISSNGTYSVKMTITAEGQSYVQNATLQNYTYTGTWTRDGDKLTITGDNGISSVATITELTNSTLAFKIHDKRTIENNGVSMDTTTDLDASFTK